MTELSDPKSIIEFLRYERKRRGKTQTQFAREIGIGLNTINRMERRHGCDISTFVMIVDHLWDDMTSFGEDYDYWVKEQTK